MRLAGSIILFGAAVYTGCAMIAIAIWTANSNPKPLTFSETFWDNLGLPVMLPGLLLWILGIGFSGGRPKDKE